MLEPVQLSRLKWRARRGMLENDLVLKSFFERHADGLDEQAVSGLVILLDLPDGDLWDLIAGRTEPDAAAGASVHNMLHLLRTCETACQGA